MSSKRVLIEIFIFRSPNPIANTLRQSSSVNMFVQRTYNSVLLMNCIICSFVIVL